MAWQSVLIPMVRNLIGDLSDTPTYDDDRVSQAIITAGLIASQEFQFDNDYTFDFIVVDIDPDPTETDTYEPEAIALFSLKAACILSMNSYQSAIATGIMVRDGDSQVDTTGSFAGYSDILKTGPCASYKSLVDSLSRKQGMNNGKAVFSPYSGSDSPWGIRSSHGIWNAREFFDGWRYW